MRLEEALLDFTKYILTEKVCLQMKRSNVSAWIQDSLE